MKKIILILLIFLFSTVLTNFASAENFVIDEYKIDINVLEDKTFEISEEIKADFTNPSHGIFRRIPLKTEIFRPNEEKYIQHARIYDVSANQPNTTSFENDNMVLKLGNPDKTILGKQTYKIKYKYDAGNDKLDDVDEFYHNLTGLKWDTSISKVYFTIKFPNDFDTSKVIFYTGDINNAENPQYLHYEVKNNVITGYTETKLNPHEGVTLRVELPDGYFTKKADFSLYAVIIAVALAIFPIMLWALFGKDEHVIPVVSFNPPKDKNSAEIEVEYLGKSTTNGVSSLIFYLASKGYIEITEDGSNLRIDKIKNYDGNNQHEKAMMNALFSGDSDYVTSTQLNGSTSFLNNCTKIQKQLDKEKSFIFEKNSCSPDKIAIIIISVVGLLVLLVYTLAGYSFDVFSGEGVVALAFPMLGIAFVVGAIEAGGTFNIIIGLIAAFLVGGVPLISIISPTTATCNFNVVYFELFCLVISFVCLFNMPKRNEHGRMLLGQILGLKKYLEVVEQHRLISILKENPNYISDILPYACVLGVVDHILDCVQGHIDAMPSWYHGSNFSRHTISSVSNTIPSAASSSSRSSSSGFSHGGCCGGGGGGGGGGSW